MNEEILNKLTKIDDNYYLDYDKYNVILVKRKQKENGEFTYKRIGFFRNVSNALQKYIDITIKENGKASSDVKELLENIENLTKFIKNYLNNMKEELKELKTKYETEEKNEN